MTLACSLSAAVTDRYPLLLAVPVDLGPRIHATNIVGKSRLFQGYSSDWLHEAFGSPIVARSVAAKTGLAAPARLLGMEDLHALLFAQNGCLFDIISSASLLNAASADLFSLCIDIAVGIINLIDGNHPKSVPFDLETVADFRHQISKLVDLAGEHLDRLPYHRGSVLRLLERVFQRWEAGRKSLQRDGPAASKETASACRARDALCSEPLPTFVARVALERISKAKQK